MLSNTSNRNAPRPTSYEDASELLGKRDSRKIGHNTYLERIDHATIGVRLHNTHIVKFFTYTPNVWLNTGGWETVTTRERMNRYLPEGFRVFNSKRVMYLGLPHGTSEPFMDGWSIQPAMFNRLGRYDAPAVPA